MFFPKLFNTTPETIKINEAQRSKLAGKNKLILGCGTDYYVHNDIHSPSEWATLDVNSKVKPDIIANAEVKGLKSKLQSENVMPSDGYDIIYSEGIMVYVFNSPHFVKNIQELLHEDGIFIADNFSQHDLSNFREHFNGVYGFFGNVIISKKPLTVDEVLDKLNNANLKSTEMIALKNKLQECKMICNEFSITNPFIQQLIPSYLVVKNYLEIDAKQDIENIVKEISKDLPLAKVIEKYPEFMTILNEKPALLQLIHRKPQILKIICDTLGKETKKAKALDELAAITEEDIFEMSKIEMPWVNLSLMPRVFQLGDADDLDMFLEQHQAGIFNAVDGLPIYKKEKCDLAMKVIYDRLTQLLKTQDVSQLKELYQMLNFMDKEKFLFPYPMGFDADVNKAIVQWAYNADASYIFNSSLAIYNFMQHAIEKQEELLSGPNQVHRYTSRV